MPLAKQVLVEFPTGNRMIYPSLRAFHLDSKSNLAAVILAMKEKRPYKNLMIRYVKQDEVFEEDPPRYYLGEVIGFETKLADYTDNQILL